MEMKKIMCTYRMFDQELINQGIPETGLIEISMSETDSKLLSNDIKNPIHSNNLSNIEI